ncbi:DNA-binding protein [Streptomyces sp. NPDC047043]|uniref:cupin domain-containing protein n=1 Tax=Streptomyces sp. NPDC047043 TaxID=3154497 RepID=UPI00340A0016
MADTALVVMLQVSVTVLLYALFATGRTALCGTPLPHRLPGPGLRRNPTVETLSLLGAALDVPARRLLTEWGTPVYVQRHDEGQWYEATNWTERLLDETYGSGYVRTLILRLERGARDPEPVPAHSAGTLHHIYVITGKLRTGPLNEPVDLAAGGFVRFPGDVPHHHICLSERVVAHVVTTLPQVRRFGPTVVEGGTVPPS